MEPQQKTTNLLEGIDTKAIEAQQYVLTPQQREWIDYKATGGIIIEDERMWKMTTQEFSAKIGVDRTTLYRWIEQIPDFWGRVARRREELHGTEFLAKMHETWKLKALKFDNWQITEAWLINFDPNYKTPKVKVEHGLDNSIVSLLAKVRQEQNQIAAKAEPIEGEIVDGPSDASASPGVN